MSARKTRVETAKAWVGKTVVITCEIETKGGVKFPTGTVMTVRGTWRGRFNLSMPDPDRPGFVKMIRQVSGWYFREHA